MRKRERREREGERVRKKEREILVITFKSVYAFLYPTIKWVF